MNDLDDVGYGFRQSRCESQYENARAGGRGDAAAGAGSGVFEDAQHGGKHISAFAGEGV